MGDLIKLIARVLVDDPDAVDIRETYGEKTLLIELKVNKRDLGKIIGKKGRNISALTLVLGCAAAKYGKRSVLKLLTDESV